MAPPSLQRTALPMANGSSVVCQWQSARHTCEWLSVVLLRCGQQSVDNLKNFFRSVNLESGGDLYEACRVYDIRLYSVIANRRRRSKCQAVSGAGSASSFLCANFSSSIVACMQFGTLKDTLQLKAPAKLAWADNQVGCGARLWKLMKKRHRARVRDRIGGYLLNRKAAGQRYVPLHYLR